MYAKYDALMLCMQMWYWLADHPDKGKSECVEALGLPKFWGDCAACEYDDMFYNNCSHCPVWAGDIKCNQDKYSYRKWVDTKGDLVARSKGAKAVANLAREAFLDVCREIKNSTGEWP